MRLSPVIYISHLHMTAGMLTKYCEGQLFVWLCVCVCVRACTRFSVLILERILDLLLLCLVFICVFLTTYTYSRRHVIPARRGEFYCIVPEFCFLLRLCSQQNLLQNDHNNLYHQLKVAYHNKDRGSSTDSCKRKVCGPAYFVNCQKKIGVVIIKSKGLTFSIDGTRVEGKTGCIRRHCNEPFSVIG